MTEWDSSALQVFQEALSAPSMEDSDSWAAAQQIASRSMADYSALRASTGDQVASDQDALSFEMEPSYLMHTGKEPSNAEVMEYLERHRLQAFMTSVIAYISQRLPANPYDFLLTHMEEMIKRHLAADEEMDATRAASGDASPSWRAFSTSPEQCEKVIRRVGTVLQHPELTKASAIRLFRQFAKKCDDTLVEEEFMLLLKSLESNWGLQADDTQFMLDVLRRWRFKANAARGTRGFPLWPLSKDDFATAYPSMLRATRDRYLPIGAIHRSRFIRKIKGIVKERYDVGRKLGRGAYGEVLLVVLKESGEQRVCKRIFQQQERLPEEDVANEVDLLRGLDHPHIIRIFEYFEEDGFINIVMEPVFGGTLSKVVTGLYTDDEGELLKARPSNLTEAWVAVALAQMLSALAYAHEVVGVIHKDLKCDNVLLVGQPSLSLEDQLKEPVHVMLADFGIGEVFSPAFHVSEGSPKMGRGRSARVGGTPSYMSPEMFQGSFTEKSDLWSLGVIFYRMMTGQLPYKADNILMQANIVSNSRRHPNWDILSAYHWSLGARKLCQQLLIKDEGMRPSATEALKNSWIIEAKTTLQAQPLSRSECRALQQQQLQSHLMRMAMHCITSQMNLSQLHRVNSQFKKYDMSGDGRLSHSEMRQVLADAGFEEGEDMDLVVQALDVDHSGKIEYSEFIAGCLDVSSKNVRAQVPVAFSIFDLDNSGSISKEELQLILLHGANDKRPITAGSGSNFFGSSPALETLLPDGTSIEKVMKDLDVDKNGRVDCFEFEKYLLKEHERIGSMLTAQEEERAAAKEAAEAAENKEKEDAKEKEPEQKPATDEFSTLLPSSTGEEA
eukprot:TRINITY_DN38732_c0_g1_i1.p1 TRINITY_DN38732_c0_g1~~TRINITY_DN38732_c0_g1_i1.p1  ORF type:complete len:842 (-),score=219.48 TRINITY_DN38732_c0_g1_i1:30-2555(-)